MESRLTAAAGWVIRKTEKKWHNRGKFYCEYFLAILHSSLPFMFSHWWTQETTCKA
jgi:hypothetical protein